MHDALDGVEWYCVIYLKIWKHYNINYCFRKKKKRFSAKYDDDILWFIKYYGWKIVKFDYFCDFYVFVFLYNKIKLIVTIHKRLKNSCLGGVFLSKYCQRTMYNYTHNITKKNLLCQKLLRNMENRLIFVYCKTREFYWLYRS